MSNPYRGNIKVRFADTDANGHAFFGNYFVFADEVLGEYWSELGLDVADVVGPDFLTFTVNANMDFLGESLAGDTLEVEVASERVGTSSVVIGFSMRNLRTDETVGRGSFTYVFVDKATRKSCPMPADFKASVLARHPELHAVGERRARKHQSGGEGQIQGRERGDGHARTSSTRWPASSWSWRFATRRARRVRRHSSASARRREAGRCARRGRWSAT